MGLRISHVAFEESSFWQRGPGVSVQNSSVMHVENVVDGDWATFILWAPDFGPSSSRWQSKGSTAIPVDFPKTGIFRKLIKLMNSLSMYNTKN